MLSKEEIECCKTEARNYIEFMKIKDNLGWAKGLLWYIEHLEVENNDLRKSVEQIYDDYQDIGKIAFDYSDKIEKLESNKQKLIEKLEEDKETLKKENADGTLQDYVIKLLEIVKGENHE